jgi:hypothetical protein
MGGGELGGEIPTSSLSSRSGMLGLILTSDSGNTESGCGEDCGTCRWEIGIEVWFVWTLKRATRRRRRNVVAADVGFEKTGECRKGVRGSGSNGRGMRSYISSLLWSDCNNNGSCESWPS